MSERGGKAVTTVQAKLLEVAEEGEGLQGLVPEADRAVAAVKNLLAEILGVLKDAELAELLNDADRVVDPLFTWARKRREVACTVARKHTAEVALATGKLIHDLRTKHKLSEELAAAIVGYSKSSVGGWGWTPEEDPEQDLSTKLFERCLPIVLQVLQNKVAVGAVAPEPIYTPTPKHLIVNEPKTGTWRCSCGDVGALGTAYAHVAAAQAVEAHTLVRTGPDTWHCSCGHGYTEEGAQVHRAETGPNVADV